MDFGVGGPREHRWLCRRCDQPVYLAELLRKPFYPHSETHLRYFWASRLKRLYGRAPPLRAVVEGGPVFCLFLLLGCAASPALRPYAALPLLGLTVLLFASEYIPLSLLPSGDINALTNGGQRYRGAARLVLLGFVAIVVLSLATELVTQYFNEPQETSRLEARSDRLTKRVASLLLVALPMVYFAYLLVGELFTSVKLPIDPAQVRRDGQTNDQAIRGFVQRLPATAGKRDMQTLIKNF